MSLKLPIHLRRKQHLSLGSQSLKGHKQKMIIKKFYYFFSKKSFNKVFLKKNFVIFKIYFYLLVVLRLQQLQFFFQLLKIYEFLK